ncbi:putative PUB domain-containing protein [Plasmopara halstedii]
MDWLKKKKEEAQQAASKITNKRTAFRGEGNVLGGGDASSASLPKAAASQSPSIKLPFMSQKPPILSVDDQQKRRELQAQALEQRGNAWEKRVAAARKARLQQEDEQENKFQYAEPSVPAPSGPSPQMLSNEQVKARELQTVQQQMGFNPYAATFASSTQAVSAMNAIGGDLPPMTASSSVVPPPIPFPAIPQVTAPEDTLSTLENGAVYVLLRQDPQRAITASETLIKILNNVIQTPEEKFRRIRLSNAAIQTKLVSVPGAVDILEEAGFTKVVLEGESYLMLPADAFQAQRIQAAIDRTEVALIQLQHDSS